MMAMVHKIYLIMMLLGINVAVKAQGRDSLNYKFSLKSAIDFALTHQTAVLNASVDEEIARNTVKQTVGIGLPHVSTSFNFQDFLKLPTTLLPGEFSSPPPVHLFRLRLVQSTALA